MNGSDGSMLWNDTEGLNNTMTKCEDDEGTDCEDVTMMLNRVTLTGKGHRMWHVLCINYKKLTAWHYHLSRLLIKEVVIDSDKYIFPSYAFYL